MNDSTIQAEQAEQAEQADDSIQAEPYYSYVNQPNIYTICQKDQTIFPGLDPESLLDPKSWNSSNFFVDDTPYNPHRSHDYSDFNGSAISITSFGNCLCADSNNENCPCGDLIKSSNFMWNFTSNVSGQDIYQKKNKPNSIPFNHRLNITSSYNNSTLNYILITFTKINFQNLTMLMDSYKEFSYPVPNGHLILFKFSLTFKNIYASRFNMFTERPKAYIDVEINDILPISNSSYTIIRMEPNSHNICYEESQNNSKDYIQYIYKRHLAKQFINENGRTLFVDDPRELHSDASTEDKIVMLGNRLAMLEDLLKKFYLDTSYLKLLKETRENYINVYKNYKKLEPDHAIEEGDERYERAI
ncbi:20822_t:CDS:2 [Gigaspora margarita]|uniref:20822_t:CDS:1 n=1 Tax=Gigaspora margarita TaxID=4874 RepID=A0ABN7WH22_GIGMA|nr:20822_t:CDS:2 [Gigaspora margarita]